jgi:hypothetical protein
MSRAGTGGYAAHLVLMQRFNLAAWRYSAPTTQLEVSLLACVVFSTLIAVALGIHYSTIG